MGQVASDVSQSQAALGSTEEGGIGRTPWQLFWGRFRQDKVALVGLVFIVLLILMALFAPWVTRLLSNHGPNDTYRSMLDSFGFPKAPNSEFWFGVDKAGRDLFVRVIYGARTSLQVAILATSISVTIGVVLGLMAGFFGGTVDTFISRAIDIVLSLPLVLFAIGIAAACDTGCRIGSDSIGYTIDPGLEIVVVVIALFSWPYIARIVRGNTLSIREKEFIDASRSLGAGNRRIMFREVLPNLVAPIIVYATLIIPNNIVFEAALAFLGLGVPQDVPSWGAMLNEANRLFDDGVWWIMVYPGLFLVATTLAFNLVGDGLRDALDPRTGR